MDSMLRTEAVERAEARRDHYISTPGVTRLFGPLSNREVTRKVTELVDAGHKPLVLKVVEDYGR